jgi:hypothetical protein
MYGGEDYDYDSEEDVYIPLHTVKNPTERVGKIEGKIKDNNNCNDTGDSDGNNNNNNNDDDGYVNGSSKANRKSRKRKVAKI